MAETLFSFGVEQLKNLVQKSERLQGVHKEQLSELKTKLNLLRFLKDADSRKHDSMFWRDVVNSIKEIVFDAEDIMETVLLKDEGGHTSGMRKRISRLSYILVDHKKIASAIGSINKSISKQISEMEKFGMQRIILADGYLQDRKLPYTYSSPIEDDPVGLEENVKKLVGYLVKEDSSQVISITGMGGIGKTTFARKVFNHEMVKAHYDRAAWVYISQQFTTKYVWLTILEQLSSKHDELIDSDISQGALQNKLFRLLETSKSLVVLDDIWREEDWYIIKHVFPSKQGCKVLLTSRNENIAFRENPTCVAVKPECLTPTESWILFRRMAFPRKDATEFEVDLEIEEIGRQMVKQCRGVPLAIKVLGGLLSSKHPVSEWKMMSTDIKSIVVGGTSYSSSIYNILYPSFKELPIHLKQCFLYLAQFPEDYEIDVEDFSNYWAAEGIPSPIYYNGATAQEVGNAHIEELVKRNMVISNRDNKTSRLKRCHLHNMVREFCLVVAKEENFLQIVDENTVASTKYPLCRRLVIHSYDHTFDVEAYTQNPRLRYLLFIKHNGSENWKVSDLFFARLQLMRVLDLSRAEFEGDKLSSDIGKLIHLRYLSLYMAKVSHLPSSMRNLKKMVYLNLCVGAISPICIPNILKKMRSLIYLFLPDYMQDKTKLELGKLINLETLENFSTKHSSVKDLQVMARLRTLSIIYNGEGCTMETLSSTLGKLRHLEKLTIGNKRVEGELLPVYKVRLAKTSFRGKRMICSRGGFPQLKKLYLNRLANWEEWIIEEGSMPLLQTLNISACGELKEVPDGLRFITSLEELTIFTVGKQFTDKISRGGEDYYRIRHIPRLNIFKYDMDLSDEDTDFQVIYYFPNKCFV